MERMSTDIEKLAERVCYVGPPLMTCHACQRTVYPVGRSKPLGMGAGCTRHEPDDVNMCHGDGRKESDLWPGEAVELAFVNAATVRQLLSQLTAGVDAMAVHGFDETGEQKT